jgi:hypothetical protein
VYQPPEKEHPMRLKEDQINRLAEKVLTDLIDRSLVELKQERGKVIGGIRAAITADIKGEEALEKDAELLLEKTLRAMGGSTEIDRHKMLRMIKDKLAKERKIVL